MIGKKLKQSDLDRLGLKPTGDIYGSEISTWQVYLSTKFHAILEKLEDGKFKVRAWVVREVRV